MCPNEDDIDICEDCHYFYDPSPIYDYEASCKEKGAANEDWACVEFASIFSPQKEQPQ